MNKKGFSLIELLIVVVIFGILAAIAVPKFMIAHKKHQAISAVVIKTTETYRKIMENTENGIIITYYVARPCTISNFIKGITFDPAYEKTDTSTKVIELEQKIIVQPPTQDKVNNYYENTMQQIKTNVAK
jgi:prepilin-type N-terminal cleavage/methylation domain-containing protein